MLMRMHNQDGTEMGVNFAPKKTTRRSRLRRGNIDTGAIGGLQIEHKVGVYFARTGITIITTNTATSDTTTTTIAIATTSTVGVGAHCTQGCNLFPVTTYI